MAEEQQPVRRRFSWSYLLSFLLIAGIIIAVIVLLFNRSGAKEFKQAEFLSQLGQNNITEVRETPKEGTLVNLNGTYKYQTQSGKTAYKSFTFNISYHELYESEEPWTYVDANKEQHYLIDNSVVADPENLDGTKVITLYSYMSKKAALAATEEKPSFVLYSAKDPYVVSWWEQWGPTILMLGGSLLICLFLFSRLSASVAGSNNKALEFNKSRARRMTNSKVHFDDVAGAEEEKVEMAELVSYLKEPKKFAKFGAKLPKGV